VSLAEFDVQNDGSLTNQREFVKLQNNGAGGGDGRHEAGGDGGAGDGDGGHEAGGDAGVGGSDAIDRQSGRGTASDGEGARG